MTIDTDKARLERQMASMELFIGKSLRVGVILSGTVIAIGLIMLQFSQPDLYSGERLRSFGEIWRNLLLGEPYAIIYAGLFLLILTPIFRVAASVVMFIYQRDFVYVVITSYVLVVLLLSFLLGKAV